MGQFHPLLNNFHINGRDNRYEHFRFWLRMSLFRKSHLQQERQIFIWPSHK